MNPSRRNDCLGTKDGATVSTPIRVCMHRIGMVRTDHRVMRDATALAEAGYQVTIIDVEGDRTRTREEDIGGVHIKHLIMPGWFTPSRFKPWFLVKMTIVIVVGTVHLLQTPADIYHAHVDKALPACYIVARLRRKPLIFDAPEMPISEPAIKRWRMLYFISTSIFNRMLQHCQGVIVTSSPTAAAIGKLYQISKVVVVRNIPPYQTIQPANRLRQVLGLHPEQPIALYQGNIQPNRELERLVYAARMLQPGIVIVMMGKSISNTKERLETLIAREGVTEQVKLLPPAPYSELLEWTASADIGLTIFSPDYSPNIRMTLPNKFFEYLMAGLPVLSTPLEAMVELINAHDVGRVIHSLTPTDIGEAINSMLTDQSALKRMHMNALAMAKQEFHWEKESQKLIQLYHEILGEKSVGNSE